MAICEITGKKPVAGKTKKHQYGGGWEYRAQKKNRVFKVNIQKKKFFIPEFKKWVTLSVSAKGIKIVNKFGLVNYLKKRSKKGDEQAIITLKKIEQK